MLLHSIRVRNLLSYGSDSAYGALTDVLELRPLNVLIGPNASGKSNLIDVVSLLQAAPGRPQDLAARLSEHGGISNWMWKRRQPGELATIMAVVSNTSGGQPLRYLLQFGDDNQRFTVQTERIENAAAGPGKDIAYFYRFENGKPVVRIGGEPRDLQLEKIDTEASILAQRKDPDRYPEITLLGENFGRIRIYRDWVFGRNALARHPQSTDLRSDFLDEGCQNLALVLSKLRREPASKNSLIANLRELYAGVEDFEVVVDGGRAQVFFQEAGIAVPATRLSDGTLRYLCLLAILCHPNPPPLVCIEEPELGLHPDVMPAIANLLVAASARMQLIVTTHSDILIDALSETPESIVVCEKPTGATTLRRLDQKALGDWLKDYRLGSATSFLTTIDRLCQPSA